MQKCVNIIRKMKERSRTRRLVQTNIHNEKETTTRFLEERDSTRSFEDTSTVFSSEVLLFFRRDCGGSGAEGVRKDMKRKYISNKKNRFVKVVKGVVKAQLVSFIYQAPRRSCLLTYLLSYLLHHFFLHPIRNARVAV